MVKIESDCVGCPPEMGCAGIACPYRNVRHFYCDKCGDDCENIYFFDGVELCIDCIEKSLIRVQ